MNTAASKQAKWIVLGIALMGAVAALLFSAQAPARDIEKKQKILWAPTNVSEALKPGQTLQVPITFTAKEDAKNVSVHIAPEIAPYVSVQPTDIARISPKQRIQLTLTFTIPMSALPATTTGSVWLERGDGSKGKQKIEVPLPVSVGVEWPLIEVNDSILPFSIRYPADWEVTVDSENVVNMIGQVDKTASFPPAREGAMVGMCKAGIGSFNNPENLSLTDLRAQAYADDPYAIRSSTPITIAGMTGVQEENSEYGDVTSVYLLKENVGISAWILCEGGNANRQGKELFFAMLGSLILR